MKMKQSSLNRALNNRNFVMVGVPRLFSLLVLGVFVFMQLPATVNALSDAQKQALQEGILYYNTEADTCSSGTIATSGGVSGGNTIWNSGLQPPYILEQFAIETLKDVAVKMNVPASDTVTQEHVIALLAFMFGEGGDINNKYLFNPLNTGLNDPSLVSGTAAANGTQSFKSFDAGVEATARTIVGSNQTRLADTLTQPQSTAEQFMYALTYYQKYSGNAFWAQASEPPNQDHYYQQHLQLVQQVRSKYADIAGLVIGTPAKEQLINETDKALLTYHPTGDQSSATNAGSTPGAGGGCLGGGIVAGSIVNTALGLAWPSTGHGKNKQDATTAYQSAMPTYNGSTGNDEWSDCGVFVATVMVASKADPNYPKRGTSVQQQYILSHPELYQTIPGVTSTSQLQPGDILVNSQHTFIYVGAQSDGYNTVEASLHGHVPQAGTVSAFSSGSSFFSENGEPFMVARLK